MQRGVERTGLDLEHVFRRLANQPGDGVSMGSAEHERAQDEEVQRALEELDASGVLGHVFV